MLTVAERTEERRDGYYVWKCRCDCGGEIMVDTKRLRRGTVTNCGCVPKATAKNGVKVKSCGCGNSRRKTTIVDLAGQRFGRLKVLYPTQERDHKGSVYWHCRCDCGNEKNITQDNLMHGNYKSCGCLKKEKQGNIYSQLHMLDGTCLEILENRKYRSDNTSGFRGVYRMRNGNYKATIGFKRQRFHIGTYADYAMAVEARLEAEELIFKGFLDDYHAWKKRGGNDPEWARKHPFVFDVEKRDGNFEIKRGEYGLEKEGSVI